MDYTTKIYDDISASKELSDLKTMIKKIEENVEKKDIENLYDIIDRSIFIDFQDSVQKSFLNIIKDLLSEEIKDKKIEVYDDFYAVGIKLPSESINLYEYAPHSSAYPTTSLIKVNFKKKQIISFNIQEDYERAQYFYKLNLKEWENKVKKQEELVNELNGYKNAREFIRGNLNIYNLPKYIKSILSPEKREKYDEIFFQNRKNDAKHLSSLREHLAEKQIVDFIDDYGKSILLRDRILRKLDVLGFEVIEEKIEVEDYKL